MTNEEMERAIDFLVRSQAASDARIGRTEEQLARTNVQVSELADQVREVVSQLSEFANTQAEIMRVMARTLEAQAEINESLRASVHELAQSQARSDRRLDALIDIVRERLGGQS